MYIFEEYHFDQLELLKKDWEELYKGKDMTIYQSYDWYLMLRSYSLKDNYLHKNVFAVCKNTDNNQILLIAPLWILCHSIWWPFNRKGAYILGCKGFSDYLNIIYDEFDSDALDYLLQEIRSRYHIHNFKFEHVREDTSLYNYIINKKIIKDHRLICVSLRLPNSDEDFLKMLSKSSRQNIRTARNRIQKDSIQIDFIFNDQNVDKTICVQMIESRLKKKNIEPDWRKRIKSYIFDYFTITFPKYLPFLTQAETYIMSAYCDDKLAAFFNYGINPNKDTIYIFTAGTNENYARYSPGILLLYEYITNTINHDENIQIVDFTRGDEKYKYVLGGKNHIVHSIRFKL